MGGLGFLGVPGGQRIFVMQDLWTAGVYQALQHRICVLQVSVKFRSKANVHCRCALSSAAENVCTAGVC